MATLVKASYHTRSISLPSRGHPLTAGVEEQLCRLRSSSEATTSSICHRLSDLRELYERVDAVLQMPLTQKALFHDKNSKIVESALDGSLRLLDICGTTRDVFSQMKECLQELESSLRRKRGGETNLANQIGAYMSSRKYLKKMVNKCFDNLKNMIKNWTITSQGIDSDLMTVVCMLREVEQTSIGVFESLLAFISQPKTKSLMSRLLQSKSSSSNEVQKIESELLILYKSNKSVELAQSKCVLKGLESLESAIQEIEEELECVFRGLVKTRVSLLNTLNH